ncbi:hypothetical protein GCM10010885_03110 [Alicyclobacillus cellulosilyticus]|uniref:Polymerase beta nucleotidyltransferase domain-containing protein n=1 Tax=Alicyclobacillus cellulosilyticus TaxID=1003997 RepID=A0A917K186_9BACL|nr:nucleotidyltransferase domain-containing protein [Alicyclobacillus cellulosilyticus]GGI96858.1 hypothetical protein GCM10010885_03110 [Alicyclobacillus cellulosilyticus]
MNEQTPLPERLPEAVSHLVRAVDPVVIYLFGSAAANRLRQDSDVDIAFLPETPVLRTTSFWIAQEMADILQRDVDLVNLQDATTVMQAEVVAKGIRLYERDPNLRAAFEMRALKAYALLNEERQCILEAIRKRGSVF